MVNKEAYVENHSYEPEFSSYPVAIYLKPGEGGTIGDEQSIPGNVVRDLVHQAYDIGQRDGWEDGVQLVTPEIKEKFLEKIKEIA